MPSFRYTILAVAAALVATTNGDYFIDPESVPLSTRTGWCQDQKNQCPLICLEVDTRDPMENSCNPNDLTYACVCGDGSLPDVEEYSLTMPYHTCTEFGNQCVAACSSTDSNCQNACREDNPCGAQNPSPPNKTTTATKDAPSPTETSDDEEEIFDGLAGQTSTPGAAGGLGGLNPIELGRGYGLAVVLGGLFVGFALL